MKRYPLGLKMNRLLGAVLLLSSAAACAGPSAHKPGGPYFFRSFATDLKEPMTLIGEMSESEAKEHASKPASVYTAWFNDQGLLEKVEKHYLGNRLMLITYKYENGKLVQVKTTDDQGKETVRAP